MKYHHDLPLGKDPSARLMPWIIAFMVYLGCLLAGATFYITEQARDWETQLGSSLTIEIPISSGVSRERVQDRVFSIVNKIQGVKSVEVLGKEQMQDLLQAWIPQGPSDIALPLIVDARLNENAQVDVAHLEKMLKTITPKVTLLDHRPWVEEVKNVIFVVSLVATLLFALLVLAIALITIFAIRTSLLIHRQVIEVLHLIGATPVYIARQFDTHSLKYGLIAGFAGMLLAVGSFVGLYYVLQGFDFDIMLSAHFLQNITMTFLIAPFLVAGLMMWTARRTVHKTLVSGAY